MLKDNSSFETSVPANCPNSKMFFSPSPGVDASELWDDHHPTKSGHVYPEKLLVTLEMRKIL